MLVTAYDEATEHRGRNNLNELKRVSPSYMRGIVVIMISESNNMPEIIKPKAQLMNFRINCQVSYDYAND